MKGATSSFLASIRKNTPYILQNSDNRIVFVIPYQDQFSLIGTTDISVEEYEHPEISSEEIAYLCATASAYLARPIAPEDVVWTYSGVRPLYDDGSTDPAAVTRDYVLKLDADDDIAPLLSIFGGKITTYRRLAEQALSELAPFFPRNEARRGPRPSPCQAATWCAATSRRMSASSARDTPRSIHSCFGRSFAATERVRRAFWATPPWSRIWAGISAIPCSRPRSST